MKLTCFVKFSRIIGISILGVVAVFAFIIYILIPGIDYCEHYKMQNNLRLPDNIGRRYCIGNIKIDNPSVVKIDDNLYVFESEIIDRYDGCDSSFINRDDVVWLYRACDCRDRFDADTKGAFVYDDIAKYLEFRDSVKGLPVYGFYHKPKSFLLTMVRKADCKCNRNMPKYECSNHVYIPALMPVFTSRQEKQMEKAMEERLLRQFQDMKNPAINLFVDCPQ